MMSNRRKITLKVHDNPRNDKPQPMEVENQFEGDFLPSQCVVKSLEKTAQLADSVMEVKVSLPTWIDRYRRAYTKDQYLAKFWFWDNFNWDKQSLWIGRFNPHNSLPENDREIGEFLQRLMVDLNNQHGIKSQIYMKLYFSRNTKNNEPEINYLIICNNPQLPEVFKNTLVNITFEKYQLTQSILNMDKDFKRLLNHYLNWNNFYIYYNLMEELQY
jgi:hypothetical protein